MDFPFKIPGLDSAGKEFTTKQYTDQIAKSLEGDLGVNFDKDYKRGTATAQLGDEQAKNLRNVLASMSSKEKEDAFGKLNYEVVGNQLVVSGMAQIDGITGGLSFANDVMRNNKRVPVLKEAMASGDPDKVHVILDPNYKPNLNAPQKPISAAPAQDAEINVALARDILNAKMAPTLKFEASGLSLTADLDAKQTQHFSDMRAQLTPEERKGLFGKLGFQLTEDPDTHTSRLTIKNPESLKVDDLSNFNKTNADALKAAISVSGTLADVKKALSHKAPVITDLSQAAGGELSASAMDFDKLAAQTGLKIPAAVPEQQQLAHASGIVPLQKTADRGIA